MSAKDDGGAAFPLPFPHHRAGMTLRDWFAGQALIGKLGGGNANFFEDTPRRCYEIADAMLAERSKP